MKRSAAQYEDAEGGMVALHRSRFVEWSPTAVVACAPAPDGSLVALARESGDLELWETQFWTCIKRVPGQEDAALTCLAWVADALGGPPRLLSGGLDGQVTDWDLAALRPRASTDTYGGAVWALAVQPGSAAEPDAAQHVAVACDDGCVRIFGAEAGVAGLAYVRSLPRVEARALSVAWHPGGQVLLAGYSNGCLHAWQPASARELLRITAGEAGNPHTCMWTVAVLPDGTMVSGDSSGAVQLWDAQLGTLLHRFQRHSADVLTVAASPDGSLLWAAGVDAQIACFQRVTSSTGVQRWEYLDSKRPHTHDVRCLALVVPPEGDPLLLSAGNDAQLLAHRVYRFLKEHPVRVCKCPQRPALHIARGAGEASTSKPAAPRLLCMQRRHVDLWQLGTAHAWLDAGGRADLEGSALDLAAPPCHLARIATKGPLHNLCSALSPDSRLIALSDTEQVRLFEVSQAEANGLAHPRQPRLEYSVRRRRLPADLPPACQLAFSSGGTRLLAAGTDGAVTVVDLTDASSPEVLAVLVDARLPEHQNGAVVAAASASGQLAAQQLAAPVTHLAVSPDDSWAAAASAHRIHFFSLQQLRHSGSLSTPEDAGPVTAIAFSPGSDSLAVATAGNQLVLYDCAACSLARWSRQHGQQLPQRLLSMPGSIDAISFSPSASVQSLVVHTPSSLCHINLHKPLPSDDDSPPKRRRGHARPLEGPHAGQPGQNFRVLPLEHPCLLLAYTSPRSALLVERPWPEVLKAFPPPLYRHRYGT